MRGTKPVQSSENESRLDPVSDQSIASRFLGVRVLGMHRSGTSFVAGAFARGGYFVRSDEKRLPPDPDNQPGYFERKDMVQLNDHILGSFGATWWLPPMADAVLAGRSRFVGLAADLLAGLRAEAGTRPVVLKDPRMACLMPVWEPVVGSQLLDVLVLRNPMDVARSLARRNGFPVQYSLALWEVYLCSLLRSLAGRPVVTVNFGALVGTDSAEALTTAMTRVFARLGIPRPEFASFASPERHFSGPDTDLLAVATPSQLRLWRYLSDLLLFEPHLTVPPELASPSEAATNLLTEVGCILGEVGIGKPLAPTAPIVEEGRTTATLESELGDALAMAHRSAAVAHEQVVGLLERAAEDSVARSNYSKQVARLLGDLQDLRSEVDLLLSRMAALLAEQEAERVDHVAAEARLRELLAASRQQHTNSEAKLQAMEREVERLQAEQTEHHAAWVRREAWFASEREAGQALMTDVLLRVTAAESALHRSETTSLEIVAESELLQTRYGALRAEMSSVLASRSWRVTRPLRWVMYRARGGRSRLPLH